MPFSDFIDRSVRRRKSSRSEIRFGRSGVRAAEEAEDEIEGHLVSECVEARFSVAGEFVVDSGEEIGEGVEEERDEGVVAGGEEVEVEALEERVEEMKGPGSMLARKTVEFYNYEKELKEMKHMTRQEFVAAIRRKSIEFSRGASMYPYNSFGDPLPVPNYPYNSMPQQGSVFPNLVVAPLSTLGNWEREFATWVPQMNVVMYLGFAQAINKSSKKSCWKQAGHDQI
ncbi:CHD3-type chromatin-remodeling factor PICKLE [Senna tora]|uniref:CHD3-type chromatin-remodeling factor PICKLE n=1 Tax=Senna tora TaxID=362788 RepID=A0A834XBF6_9FABA|nr:CHD3-type chromatin-remodeling factor PICKLE [Senna tora]